MQQVPACRAALTTDLLKYQIWMEVSTHPAQRPYGLQHEGTARLENLTCALSLRCTEHPGGKDRRAEVSPTPLGKLCLGPGPTSGKGVSFPEGARLGVHGGESAQRAGLFLTCLVSCKCDPSGLLLLDAAVRSATVNVRPWSMPVASPGWTLSNLAILLLRGVWMRPRLWL